MINKFNWNDKELLKNIIDNSITQSEVLNKIGIQLKSGNHQTFLKYVKFHNLDISHFDGKKVAYQKLQIVKKDKEISNEEYFIKGSKKVNHNTIRRILKGNLKEHRCEECGCLPIWNNKPLKLQLDHINGDNCDNRLDNLRFLCPNCHTQTITFAGKNKEKSIKEKIFDIERFTENREIPLKENIFKKLNEIGIRKSAKFFKISIKNLKNICNYYEIDLYKISKNLKIDWPNLEEMQKLLLKNNFTNLGKILGVSDKAVKNYAMKNNLFIPSSITQGYWISKSINKIQFEDLVLENGEYKLRKDYDINAKEKVQSLETIS